MACGRTLLMLLAVVGAAGCGSSGGGSDGGPADAGPADAGCDAIAQTGCASGERCSLVQTQSGNTVTTGTACTTDGTTAAYAACTSNVQCSGATICSQVAPEVGYQSDEACYPLCNPATSLQQPCSLGGTCVGQIEGTEFGFCDRPTPDGGPGDAG